MAIRGFELKSDSITETKDYITSEIKRYGFRIEAIRFERYGKNSHSAFLGLRNDYDAYSLLRKNCEIQLYSANSEKKERFHIEPLWLFKILCSKFKNTFSKIEEHDRSKNKRKGNNDKYIKEDNLRY